MAVVSRTEGECRAAAEEIARATGQRAVGFAADVTDAQTLRETLTRLSNSVCEGLAGEGLSGRTVTVKLRLAPFRTRTRSQTLAQPTRDPELVARVARELLGRFELDSAVRLIGVGVSSLRGEDGSADANADPALVLPI